MFASCPTGCTNDEILSVRVGENIKFNTTVIHTSGGSCGFKQKVQRIELMKLNNVNIRSLSFCNFGPGQEGTCNNNHDRVSVSRGRNPRHDFVFLLSNAILNIDSGVYQIAIWTEHPATGSLIEVTKTFHVTITNFSEYNYYCQLRLNKVVICYFLMPGQTITTSAVQETECSLKNGEAKCYI